MSHYIALFAQQKTDSNKNNKNDTQEAHIGDEIADIMAILLNLCSTKGLILDRWLTVYTTMLEKIIGLDRIDKIRVIHIMESDLNLLLGILFGKRLAQHAEKK